MNRKNILSIIAVAAFAVLSVAAVSAQGKSGNRGGSGQLAEITGLDATVIQAARDAGQTLAEAITANGGDVAAVEAALTAHFSQDSDADAVTIAERVNDMLNTPLEARTGGNRADGRGNNGEALAIITEATGLDAAVIRDAKQSGQTLSEIITANGGDVATVEAALIDLFSQDSDTDAATIAERVNNFLNSVREGRPNTAPVPEGTNL